MPPGGCRGHPQPRQATHPPREPATLGALRTRRPRGAVPGGAHAGARRASRRPHPPGALPHAASLAPGARHPRALSAGGCGRAERPGTGVLPPMGQGLPSGLWRSRRVRQASRVARPHPDRAGPRWRRRLWGSPARPRAGGPRQRPRPPQRACTPVQGPAPHRPHGAPGRALARWPVPCPPRGFPPMLSLALPRRVRSRVAHRCAPSPSGFAPLCLSLAASAARCAPRRTSNAVPRSRGGQRSGSARALMGRGAPAPGRYAASSGADSPCRANARALPPCTMFSSPGLTGRQRHNGSSVRNRARWSQPLWPRWRWRLRLYVHLENHKVADPMLEAPFPPPASAHPTC